MERELDMRKHRKRSKGHQLRDLPTLTYSSHLSAGVPDDGGYFLDLTIPMLVRGAESVREPFTEHLHHLRTSDVDVVEWPSLAGGEATSKPLLVGVVG